MALRLRRTGNGGVDGTRRASKSVVETRSSAPAADPPLPAPTVDAVPSTVDPDAALKDAIKAAIDSGDLSRATKLLEVLRATAPAAGVIDLASRRR